MRLWKGDILLSLLQCLAAMVGLLLSLLQSPYSNPTPSVKAPTMAVNKLNFDDLAKLWIAAGGPAQVAGTAAAIALAESSGRPDATNPNDNHGLQTSWGLWQVSQGNHTPYLNWDVPLVNAQIAVAKYNAAGGFSPWGTFTSGAYKQYLPANNRYATVTQGASNSDTMDPTDSSNVAQVGNVKTVQNYWKIHFPFGSITMDPLLFGGLATLGTLIFVAGSAFLVIGIGKESKTARSIVSTATNFVPQLKMANAVKGMAAK